MTELSLFTGDQSFARRSRYPLFTLITLIFGLSAHAVLADDWPQWQGPHRNSISQESGLLQNWPRGGPQLAWRIDHLGGGDSAPAVANGNLYGMSNRNGKEIVWALAEVNGQEIWKTPLGNAVEQRMPQSKEGPGGTPTVDRDRLYVVGMGGTLCCLNAQTGDIIWRKSFTSDFGGTAPTWSYRESPLIDGEKLICTPGGSDAMLVALNKETGETIWKSHVPAAPAPVAESNQGRPGSPGRPGGRGGFGGRGRFGGRGGFGFGGGRSGAAYSSVIPIEFENEKQYVQLTSSALIGVSAIDGKFLWRYDRPANGMGINCSTPVSQDGLIFAASAYGAGGGAVQLSKNADGDFKADEVYFTSNMQNHHGGMIVVDGCLYGANGGNEGGFLACMDFQTGEILWRDRNAPKGSLAMADGRLYLRSETGPIYLIEPSREGLIVRGQFDQPDRSRSPAWAHPVIANGKLYIRDQELLLCYDISAK